MIDEIKVQDLALIEEASLVLSPGLTVLTGETGAGKTALISALKLLMGARASSDAVRDGCKELCVQGRFYNMASLLDDPSQVRDDAADTTSLDEDELVVTRTVTSEGRSRATLNGQMVSAGELAQVIAPSIDLCGQFEHQQLMKVATHVALLDSWASQDVSTPLSVYRSAYEQAQEAARLLDEVRNASEMSSAKLDEARFILKRIDEVNPQLGEYEQLMQDLQLAEHAEALMRAVTEARAALADDGGALDSLNIAAAALESVASVDANLATAGRELREAGYAIEDVAAQVRSYAGNLEFDPEQLEQGQERLSALQGLMRTYGPRMEDVLERRADAARTISLVDDHDQSLQQAQKAVSEAESALADAADALDAARNAAAPHFVREVCAVMDRLQMGGAQLSYDMQRLPRESWTAQGPSSFEFTYKPVADGHARPLAKIASGGEMSRVLLSVKTVLGAKDDVQVLVFDEVDAGVGGAVAVALAQLLRELAETHQVVVVTHLAQVAVFGDVHYVVQRNGDKTSLVCVEGEARVGEIARMLSGSITDASLAHARELLQK